MFSPVVRREIEGCLEPSSENPADSLIIGTETTLQAYNVEENRDLFFVEVGDGISTIVFKFSSNKRVYELI